MSEATPAPVATAAKPHTTDDPRHRPVRSFVKRAGRSGPGQARALADLGPLFLLPYQPAMLDWAARFGRTGAPRVLEIGFGMGDATAQIAAAHPEWDYLGLEVHEPGVGALLRRIGEAGLNNLRIVAHDAVEVIEHMIEPASLQAVHIYFPDPWPKKRHHKRRLIQPPFVERLASRLRPGGYLHLATDWQPYAQQMLEVLQGCTQWVNSEHALPDGYSPRPDWRPQTKFERRGLALGHGVWDLVFHRR
jgi:tRNA (guanine-N7-)-methyltransferase